MAADEKPVVYVKLKEFLARNKCVNPRTFTRWKKRGFIDFIQPGGPNTEILVPEDALERIERRKVEASNSEKNVAEAEKDSSQSDSAPPAQRSSGPIPRWKKKSAEKKHNSNERMS